MKKVLLLFVFLIMVVGCVQEVVEEPQKELPKPAPQSVSVPEATYEPLIQEEITEEELEEEMPELQIPSESEYTVVGSHGTMYTSSNFGENWEQTKFGQKDLFGVTREHASLAVGSGGQVIKLRGGTWKETPSNAEFELHDTTFIDGKVGWAAGSGGLILKTIDGGLSWDAQTVPLTTPHLWGIDAIDEQNVVAVGNDGYILVTTDSGETWNRVEVRPLSKLRGVQFVSDTIGWVVGSNGVTFKTMDKGQSWERRDIETADLKGLHFLNEMNGYVVGVNGAILHTIDAGETWTEQKSGTKAVLWDVDFVNEARGCVVGISQAIICTSDGGETWERKIVEDAITLHGISSTSKDGLLTGNVVKVQDQGVFWDWLDSYLGLS